MAHPSVIRYQDGHPRVNLKEKLEGKGPSKKDLRKPILFSQTLEVPENKIPFFSLFGIQADILTICAFDQIPCLAEITCKENPCALSLDCH